MAVMTREARLAAIVEATLRAQGYNIPRNNKGKKISKRRAEMMYRDRFKERVRKTFS